MVKCDDFVRPLGNTNVAFVPFSFSSAGDAIINEAHHAWPYDEGPKRVLDDDSYHLVEPLYCFVRALEFRVHEVHYHSLITAHYYYLADMS